MVISRIDTILYILGTKTCEKNFTEICAHITDFTTDLFYYQSGN